VYKVLSPWAEFKTITLLLFFLIVCGEAIMGLKRASLVRKIHAIREIDPEAGTPPTADEMPLDGQRSDTSETSDIGGRMRAARARLGLTVDDVSATLRIRKTFIEAIEAGRSGDLPGMTYAIGYVRSYANFLKLDANATIEQFKREASGLQTRTELVFPSPAPEGRVPGGAALLVGLVLAIAVYGGWYYMTSKDYLLADLVPDVPERLARLVEPGADRDALVTALPEDGGRQQSAGQAVPSDGTQDGLSTLPQKASGDGRTDSESRPAQTAVTVDQQTNKAVPPTTTAAVVTSPSAEGAAETAVPPTETAAVDSALETAATATALPVTTPTTAAPETAVSETAVSETATRPAPEPLATVPPAAVPQATVPSGSEEGTNLVAAGSALSTVPKAPELKNLAISSAQATATAEDPAPQIGGPQQATAGRIMIKAIAPAWVRVRDVTGAVRLSKVLGRGETYTVPKGGIFELSTGDAASLELYLDEKPVQPIGGRGQIVQNFKLDPARLVIAASN
jgi:cytoskeleton protein RodZ